MEDNERYRCQATTGFPVCKYRSVAVDFDGMITENNSRGYQVDYELKLRENCGHTLTRLWNDGVRLILHTCRTGDALDEAKKFLKAGKLWHMFGAVNEQLPEIHQEWESMGCEVARKVYAELYLDDRGLGTPTDWYEIERMLFDENPSDINETLPTDIYSDTTYAFQWLNHTGNMNREDTPKLPEILSMMLAVQYDKEGGYGTSWRNRGEYRSIVPNIDRKYDRLSKIIEDEIEGNREILPTIPSPSDPEELRIFDAKVGESKIDSVADFTIYGLLYLSWLRWKHPGAFGTWIRKNIPQYLRVQMPFLKD